MRFFPSICACFLAVLACLPAHAHQADQDYTLTVTCDLDDGQITETVYIPAWFLMDEVYGDKTTIASLLGKDADCKAQIAGWMAYNNPVLIDGRPVKLAVTKLEARSAMLFDNQPFPGFAADMREVEDSFLRHSTSVKITLAAPLAKAPETVSLRWRRYFVHTLADGTLSQPPVSLAFFHDDKHRITDLTPAEPEWVWHSEAAAPPPASALISQKWEPVKWHLPAGALMIVFAGLAAALVLWRKNKTVAMLALAADIGLAVFVWQAGIGLIATDSPFQKQLVRPDEAQARIILDDLLHGVYKAFDYNKDAQIYDALAHCVDGPLLEKIYRDVHGALVLDDQEGGGAVCQVEQVKITRAELKPAAANPADPDAITLGCDWQVRGKVSHWGHTHLRANAYRATYTLAPRAGADGPRWKITGCTVTQEKPLEVETKSAVPQSTSAKAP